MTWDFAGKAVSSAKLSTVPTVELAFTASDVYGDQIYNSNNAAYLVVPAPLAPTLQTAVQSGDHGALTWTLASNVNPSAVTSSTLTATPVNSTVSVVTTIVGGSATNGLVGPLQADTTYNITVVSITIGGSSGQSNALTLTTSPATVAPSVPTGVTAHWTLPDPPGTTDTIVATWNAADPGDSPVDSYEVVITDSDGAGTFSQTVSGSTLTASFTVDYSPDWSVTVRAHNAAGYGPWSTSFMLGGL